MPFQNFNLFTSSPNFPQMRKKKPDSQGSSLSSLKPKTSRYSKLKAPQDPSISPSLGSSSEFQETIPEGEERAEIEEMERNLESHLKVEGLCKKPNELAEEILKCMIGKGLTRVLHKVQSFSPYFQPIFKRC